MTDPYNNGLELLVSVMRQEKEIRRIKMAKEEMCHYKRHYFRKDSPVFSLLATSNKSFLLLTDFWLGCVFCVNTHHEMIPVLGNTLTYSCIVYGSFHAIAARLHTYNRDHLVCKA